MSVLDNKRRGGEQKVMTTPLSSSTQSSQGELEQLDFPAFASMSAPSSQSTQPFQLSAQTTQALSQLVTTDEDMKSLTGPLLSPHVTQALVHPMLSPGATRELPELRTNASLSVVKDNTTSLRVPVVIHGTGKKEAAAAAQPSKTGQRIRLNVVVSLLVMVVLAGTLFTFIPLGPGGRSGISLFQSRSSVVKSSSSNTGLIASQIATATAVTQGGYDPGPGKTFVGVPAAPAGTDTTGDHFFYGQCTYWASYRYHQLTGLWVPWYGNANQWASGGANSGWIVSDTPHVPSIIVLQGGIQGASWGYGHVALVESINADGSVHTSNWNWNGFWGSTTYVDFKPGGGVSFVWAPGH